MSGPGGGRCHTVGFFTVQTEEWAAHSRRIVFNQTQIDDITDVITSQLRCSTGTVWEKVAPPPRSRFVQLKGFGLQHSPPNQSQQTGSAEWEPLALLTSDRKHELYADGDAFPNAQRLNGSDRLLFTVQPLQNRLSDSRIYWSL